MLSIALLSVFLLLGLITAQRLFSMLALQIRAWLGLVLGIVEMMWLPALFAFGLDFTVEAHLWAVATALIVAVVSSLIPKRRKRGVSPPAKLVLWLVLPLLIVSAYLQYTHTFMPVNGGYNVGQSTYGDLCLHVGIATGLKGAGFPPEYTILPGTVLGYPFLFDALSSSMLLFGSELSMAFIVPGVLAMGLVYWGFVILAWEMTRDARAVTVSYLLFFLNGGLGFIYVLDGFPGDLSKLRECLFDFYRTPTNMPDYNLRWVNVICDLMIPQRTLLAGWTTVLPALYMLVRAVRTNSRRMFITLGVWAGLMPMIHTHSFLALGLISVGCMTACLIKERDRKEYLINFLIYGFTAVLLAIGQLLKWTFPQSLGSGTVKFCFNWVNNDSGRLIDGYFWFWIKNVGLVYLMLVPAALTAPRRLRYLAAGCLAVYVAAECVQFQQNIYDNNKLFYVAFMLIMPLVGSFLIRVWDRMKRVRFRAAIAAVFMTACLISGVLTVAREAMSSYTIFSPEEIEAARFIDEYLPRDCVILTSTNHNNAVSTLAGRKIVCGTPSYLFFHGVNYSEREDDAREMYENPVESLELFEKYDVMYIYISSHEAMDYDIDYDAIWDYCEIVFDNGFVKILSVPDGIKTVGG